MSRDKYRVFYRTREKFYIIKTINYTNCSTTNTTHINNGNNMNHIDRVRSLLEQKAGHLSRQAAATTDKFNKGYFEGKAEAFLLASKALACTSDDDIIDALNGDKG